ncbi:MAG: carboxymuconolactone decarboxylase family protein [Betaproteobacteria bacterium]|jgi:4-carboxymuconolactone decarboxylase|nr:carboxymuconolactone decarboxylase family protein [Betaproteobacteria bacterium]
MTDQADNRRFPLIPLDRLTPEQQALSEAIKSGPRSKLASSGASKPGPLGGPFNVWLRSPGIGNLVQQLGEEIRFRSSLSGKLNELAILVTARNWTSQYEWVAHHKLALEGGLNPKIAEAIAQGRRPEGMDADETLVYEFSTELQAFKGVSDAMFARAVARFGERGVVDLISVNGFYVLVSMCLNVDRTPVPPGTPLPLPPLG